MTGRQSRGREQESQCLFHKAKCYKPIIILIQSTWWEHMVLSVVGAQLQYLEIFFPFLDSPLAYSGSLSKMRIMIYTFPMGNCKAHSLQVCNAVLWDYHMEDSLNGSTFLWGNRYLIDLQRFSLNARSQRQPEPSPKTTLILQSILKIATPLPTLRETFGWLNLQKIITCN